MKRTQDSVTLSLSQRPAKRSKARKFSMTRQPRYIIGRTRRSTLRYSQSFVLAAPATDELLGTYIFSANGCYDPNISGLGHQPRGFDQVMALYDHYTVVSSTCTVRYLNTNGAARPYVGIAVRDSAEVFPDMDTLMEYGNKVVSTRPLSRSATSDNGGNSTSTILSTKCNVSAFLGKKDIVSDSETKGSSAANPAEQVYYHVVAGSPDGNAANIQCIVSLTFDVILHEPKQPLSS